MITSGGPPLSETRTIPLAPWPTNKLPPFQLMPNGLAMSDNFTGDPPVIAILFNVPGNDQYAIHLPSGENTGLVIPPLVDNAVRGLASSSHIVFRYSRRFATYAIRMPSGESAST